MLVTAIEYSKLRSHGSRWATDQITAGMPTEVRGKRGSAHRIDLGRAVQWEIDKAVEKAEASFGGERGRLLRAQAERVEAANSKRRTELLLVSYVEHLFDGFAAHTKDRLDAIGRRLAKQFPGIPPETVIARLRIETDNIISALAGYREKLLAGP